MRRLHFTMHIHAPAEMVYRTMLGLDQISTYEQWTAEFNPSSTYQGTWEKDSKILFLGYDQEGNRAGMIAKIAENKPNEYVSIVHYGILEGDKEITSGPQVEPWAGVSENYTFKAVNGGTDVTIELDADEDYITYFNTTWPKALETLKQMVELKA